MGKRPGTLKVGQKRFVPSRAPRPVSVGAPRSIFRPMGRRNPVIRRRVKIFPETLSGSGPVIAFSK